MKVLLFTHKVDIDGMGSAVLSNLAFGNVDIVFCETFEVDERFNEFLIFGNIFNYDYVFITDICPSEDVLKRINQDERLNKKVKVFDHHKIQIEDLQTYDFITLQIQNDKGLCCGTSLFYSYLLKEKFLQSRKSIDGFVELTRQYDTWEWKHVYHNEDANNLNLLFNILGREEYIKHVLSYLKEDSEVFALSETENSLIDSFKKEIDMLCDDYVSKMKIKNIDGNVVGVIRNVQHRCRNDVSQKVIECKKVVDYIVFDLEDRDTISFRSINSGFDVSIIATKFGGKGHKNASSCPKTEAAVKYFFN